MARREAKGRGHYVTSAQGGANYDQRNGVGVDIVDKGRGSQYIKTLTDVLFTCPLGDRGTVL